MGSCTDALGGGPSAYSPAESAARARGVNVDDTESHAMDGWDVFFLVVSGYVATMALARLMIRRRNQLIDELVHEAGITEKAEKTATAKAEKAEAAETAEAKKQKQKAA